jgi:hypothetical protein
MKPISFRVVGDGQIDRTKYNSGTVAYMLVTTATVTMQRTAI